MKFPARVRDVLTQQNFEAIERMFREGSGSPEGVVNARPGTQYVDRDGGAGATLYVKEVGTGATGWAAK